MADAVLVAPVISCLGPKQAAALRGSTARVNIFEGAIRSGKTVVSLIRFLIAVIYARGGAIVVVARTRDSAYRNVFEPLMNPELFGTLAHLISYTAGAPTAKILGRTVHVLGANDAKAEKVLRGLTVALAYVDEVTVIPEEFFTQLLGRMSPPGAQLFGTTNPESPAHWLKAKFLDRIGRDLQGWVSYHFNLDDNPGLTEQYKLSIKAEFTGLSYKRFVLGEWVAAEGAIFDMWDAEIHTIPRDELPKMLELIAVGVDYGTTNPTAAIILGISAEYDAYGRPRPRLFFVDEYRHDSKVAQQKLTDAELSKRLRDWLDTVHLPPVDVDPSPPSLHDPRPVSRILSCAAQRGRAALHTGRERGPLRHPPVASLLAAGKLIVARPTDKSPDRGCPGFIFVAPGYAWDPKATLKGEDKPLKIADHSLDAGRYSIVTTERLWRNRIDFGLAA